MKISDLSLWHFDQGLFEGCSIICPECGEPSVHTDWREGTVDCESCGYHDAIICPKCNHQVDHVWSDLRIADSDLIIVNRVEVCPFCKDREYGWWVTGELCRECGLHNRLGCNNCGYVVNDHEE